MDPDLFHEPHFDFSLRKPSSWRFVPSQWSPLAQLKNLDHPSAAWARNANVPFCCAMRYHDSPLHAPCAVQVSARPPIAHNQGLASTMLESQLSHFKDKYPDFEVLDASTQIMVAGCHATYIRGTFSVVSAVEEAPVQMLVLSRVYLLFSSHGLFSIGLSGSADPQYFSESDFEEILASVRIGA